MPTCHTLEESVKDSRERERAEADSTPSLRCLRSHPLAPPLTPGQSTAQAVTPHSKCDYTICTVRDRVPGKVVAL